MDFRDLASGCVKNIKSVPAPFAVSLAGASPKVADFLGLAPVCCRFLAEAAKRGRSARRDRGLRDS
jgi:hypothetical protein